MSQISGNLVSLPATHPHLRSPCFYMLAHCFVAQRSDQSLALLRPQNTIRDGGAGVLERKEDSLSLQEQQRHPPTQLGKEWDPQGSIRPSLPDVAQSFTGRQKFDELRLFADAFEVTPPQNHKDLPFEETGPPVTARVNRHGLFQVLQDRIQRTTSTHNREHYITAAH
eukprot:6199978-Pleurochrysis_carterae.AAC.8